jgi:hypothetical protein
MHTKSASFSKPVTITTSDKSYDLVKVIKGKIKFKADTIILNESMGSQDDFKLGLYNNYCNKELAMKGYFRELSNMSKISSYKGSLISEIVKTTSVRYKIKFLYNGAFKEDSRTIDCEDLIK